MPDTPTQAQSADISHHFDENVEQRLAQIIVTREYQTAQTNQSNDFLDFESYVDLFDAVRSEKDYDWMSDIFIPEFPSHELQQSAEDVSQYFQTRDFVECYVMDESDEAVAASKSAQECINRTLNQRQLFHYQKYVRAKAINHLIGYVWLHCWWEQELTQKIVATEFNPETGEQTPIHDYDIVKDRFNYEVLDPRNVFCDNRYVYSAQQKSWITIRSETTYEKLLAEAESMGYFNLDLVKSAMPKAPGKTETASRSGDLEGTHPPYDNLVDVPMDKLKRYGTFWYKDGKPGINEYGEKLEGASLEECVSTVVMIGGTNIVIGFYKQPYRDVHGNPYKPLIRGLCYVHPTKDNGVGDGKYAKELQIGINDTFNMNNDRTHLATIPTLSVRRGLSEDTDSLYFEPGHPMERDDKDDIIEFKISDNIAGGLNQMGVLTDKMRQVTATTPPDLGSVPALSSTTATASSLAQGGSNKRNNYKSMTFENTAMAELYWMILQMTWTIAKPETGRKLMGDKVFDFNLDFEYWFRPLSQSIEPEQRKDIKVQRWSQILGYVAQIPHPNTVNLVNYIIAQIAALMGDEYANFGKQLLNPNTPIQNQQGGMDNALQIGQSTGGPSNQYGVPQQGPEVSARIGA